jgi:hypothetical protein
MTNFALCTKECSVSITKRKLVPAQSYTAPPERFAWKFRPGLRFLSLTLLSKKKIREREKEKLESSTTNGF